MTQFPVLVGSYATAVPSTLDPRPEEEAVMPNPVDLEPQAKAVADANANPPYLFELGPDQGRRTIDAAQSSPVKKPTVDIEDTRPAR